jgi:poly-beta-1,6-N-acetyl-D-glucosamine synthase
MWYQHLSDWIFGFAFYYPLFMAYLWMAGALYYYFSKERKESLYTDPPLLPEYPHVSVLVPCYNEGLNAKETIGAMLNLNYPNYDIVVINDGSSDNTAEVIDAIAAKHANVRAIQLASNQGKAMALTVGAMLSSSEYLVCIDGDAVLDPHCITWMMRHFVTGSRVGAVTGNPRIRNRSTMLGRLQVGEFSSVIGLIKRAQRVYGRVFTVSGVVAAFRKSALHQVGYWSTNMVTEDIDISWKMQTHYYDVRYEPNALCWILMPETLLGLWRQRLRWAQGGAEVLLKFKSIFTEVKKRRMWPVYTELVVSIIWSYTITTIFLLWAIGKFVALPPALHVNAILPGWNGVILAMTCLLQFALSLFIDSRYEPKIRRYYYWMIWYPMLFWMLSAATTVVGLPAAIIKDRNKRATWKSPDRGVHQERLHQERLQQENLHQEGVA